MSDLIKSNDSIVSRYIIDKLGVSEPDRFYSGVEDFEYNDFRSQIHSALDSGSFEFLFWVIDMIFQGRIFILRGCLDTGEIARVIRSCKTLIENCPDGSGCRQITSRVPDGFMTSKYAGAEGYHTYDRSFYFFPWNKHNSNSCFDLIALKGEVSKMISGLPLDCCSDNSPEDGIIERVHVINYPAEAGLISEHVDPFCSVLTNTGLYLTEYGRDYSGGGFFVRQRSAERKVLIDSSVKRGDMVLFYPGMYHGVDPVTSIDGTDGRWFVTYNLVQSHLVQNRKKSLPVRQFDKD